MTQKKPPKKSPPRIVADFVSGYWDKHGRIPLRKEASQALDLNSDYYSSLLSRAVRDGLVKQPEIVEEVMKRVKARQGRYPAGSASHGGGCSAEMAQKIVDLLLNDAGCSKVSTLNLERLTGHRNT